MLGDGNSIGSNNWVIDGKKSASGKPILASDPHLGFNLPCVWYVAHVKGGDLDAIGVSLPGVPMIVIGHNRHIAWGMTNTQADVTDFYIETLNEERTHYSHESQWKPLDVFTETIKVLGREPLELKIPATAHGPILPAPEADLAIQWIGAEPDDDALAFSLLGHAADYDDFAAAMQTLNAPPQNFNYADTNGMTAMWVAGLFPVRKAGFGRVPVDGASGEFDWTGFIPRIDTPHSVNPAQHYLASANQRPAPGDYPYYLGYEWDPGYRARRINRLLSSNDSITMDMMKSFQADTYDTAAESMLPHLIAACKDEFEEDKLYAQALETLTNWDFLTSIDKPAPTIWWKWLDKFRDAVWQDEWRAAGIEMQREAWGHTDLNKWQPPLEVLERMVVEEPVSKWFDDVSTEERETLREIACKSLRQAVDELLLRLGEDISEWNWGRVNRLRIDHLSSDPLLVRGGQPLSGSDFTLCARGAGRDVTSGPSWRMVVDFSDLGGAVGVLPGGQSGDPESPHYDDLLDKWVGNEYVPLLFYSAPEQFPADQVEVRMNLSAPSDETGLMTP
jgi:penicillin amidase